MARNSKSKATAHLNKQESTRRATAKLGEESDSTIQVVQHNRRSKVLAGSICKKSPTRSSARLVNKRNGTIGLQAPKATIHDLPIELRVKIIKYLLCSAKEIEDIPDALSSRCELQTSDEEANKFASNKRYQLHPQILRTNFQFFHEGQYLLCRSGNKKHVFVTYNIAPKSEVRCYIAGESSFAQAPQKYPDLRNVQQWIIRHRLTFDGDKIKLPSTLYFEKSWNEQLANDARATSSAHLPKDLTLDVSVENAAFVKEIKNSKTYQGRFSYFIQHELSLHNLRAEKCHLHISPDPDRFRKHTCFKTNGCYNELEALITAAGGPDAAFVRNKGGLAFMLN